MTKKTLQDEQRSTTINNLSGFVIGKRNKQIKQNKSEKGTLEFSLGNLFKCICCTYSGVSYEEKRLNEINESLQQINKRLNLLDRFDKLIIHHEIQLLIVTLYIF